MSQPSTNREGDGVPGEHRPGPLDRLIRFCLEQKLVVALLVVFFVVWGLMSAPFDWSLGGLPRDPVAVDAIPDIGENQQIVFTSWPGRSPQDVEDQVTYPLTVSLLGTPGVKTVRSSSGFGFSSIYVIFNEGVDYYWSRSRILEKLNSLPIGTLPTGVSPALGPDATALGQVFWYTLEGRDPDGKPAGGWDLDELRSTQDWYVRYALASASGVAEVSSIGGFVREYQIDVDPDAMRAHSVTLDQIFNAVRKSNVEVGARTIEINRVEYLIRGLGFVKSVQDIEKAVVRAVENTPITVGHVASVTLGPAMRRGALDKGGAEAVGGVVVARYGENPLATIKNVKQKIKELTPGLPVKAVIDWSKTNREEVASFAKTNGFDGFNHSDSSGGAVEGLDQDAWLAWLTSHNHADWPAWITTSKVTVVPFYDRSDLIYETLDTLNDALLNEVLITVIVVIVMVMHLRSSLLISGTLPLVVLMTFIAMKVFGVDANVVALSGIAIAIGTVVDVGIVLTENILKHLDDADPAENRLEVIYRAATEVSSAVLTAVATTVVGFLPVFTMIGAEGKLFRPLAFTKTFALIASIIVALTIIPPVAHVLLGHRRRGIKPVKQRWARTTNVVIALLVAWLLTRLWLPLGPGTSVVRNFIFVIVIIGGLLWLFHWFQRVYEPMLRWALDHKISLLAVPVVLTTMGACVWVGFDRVFGFIPAAVGGQRGGGEWITQAWPWRKATAVFPGLGKEFMPSLDEGSFLFMPTTMPHASIGEALDVIQTLDRAIESIPEVDMVVGKIGRVESPLDPAPVSMIETVIHYKPQYAIDENGHPIRFKYDTKLLEFVRDDQGQPVPYQGRQPFTQGRLYRQWRDHIHTPDDIWNEITRVAKLPGTTGAPKLQPIQTRIVMLQTGMRASMGVKVTGPDLETIESVGLEIERLLKETPGVDPATVNAERIVGKPYLEIDIDRDAIQRYNLKIADVQNVIEVAIGGKTLSSTVEGRQRYPIRVRYMRELRDSIESIQRVLVAAPDGTQIPLGQVSDLRYVRGPQVIKSEDTFLIGYVTFGKLPGFAEVDVVQTAERYLEQSRVAGKWTLPNAVSYRFTGSYENQIRAQKTLAVVLPLSLGIIFLILYFQFRSTITSLIIFSGIVVAWAGGFLLIWLYGQPWFLNFDVFGTNMRTLFGVHAIDLSVAIWVGFLALFGIASDNGVVIATYLKQSFSQRTIRSVADIREATVQASLRRARPCLMTTATTILALLPVLTSTGRGSDIMIPMAIPSFGGMALVLISMFMVPMLYCAVEEIRFKQTPT